MDEKSMVRVLASTVGLISNAIPPHRATIRAFRECAKGSWPRSPFSSSFLKMIHFKPGARFDFVEPQTLRALADFAEHWAQIFPNTPFVVTSGTDGEHQSGSFHYKGLAWDFRTHELPTTAVAKLEQLNRDFMASYPGWQVFVESVGTPAEHGHAEFDGLRHAPQS